MITFGQWLCFHRTIPRSVDGQVAYHRDIFPCSLIGVDVKRREIISPHQWKMKARRKSLHTTGKIFATQMRGRNKGFPQIAGMGNAALITKGHEELRRWMSRTT